ncbi:hypothetical protein BDW59DRAFT_115346 [Aspergillus cavernicola]|uniref:HMG box domain-containing protein n=1 Tax=Aspergillus cavernicola TaxID=176166 RepID=A0ABR4IWI0_9EURO
MPLNIVHRGGGILRTLPVNVAFARPVRVAASQHHIKRISFAACRPLSTSVAPNVPRSNFLVGNFARSYATVGRMKGSLSKKKKPIGRPRGTRNKKTEQKTGELTDAQKAKEEAKTARAEAKKKKLLVQELKKTALKVPKKLPIAGWTVRITRLMPEAKGPTQTGRETFSKACELARAVGAEESQRDEDVAKANKAANKAAYTAWIQSHTPTQIMEANQARLKLNRMNKTKLQPLQDDRLVKRPRQPWIHFFTEKRLTDGGSGTLTEVSARMAVKWRALSESEKEKYYQLARKDRERYEQEYLKTYGIQPPHISKKDSKKAQ